MFRPGLDLSILVITDVGAWTMDMLVLALHHELRLLAVHVSLSIDGNTLLAGKDRMNADLGRLLSTRLLFSTSTGGQRGRKGLTMYAYLRGEGNQAGHKRAKTPSFAALLEVLFLFDLGTRPHPPLAALRHRLFLHCRRRG